jgi:hypothetical protein
VPSRIVLLCDWLPPDFGAVGQYAVGFARELAEQGHHASLVGFSSTASSCVDERVGTGTLRTRRLHRPVYDRANLFARAWWTLGANLALLWGARRELRGCDEIRFTGSPPYLIHFVMPLAMLLGVRTRYRITDFHPECLVAALGRTPPGLRLLGALTNFWRRRVDVIEVLGDDQARRLAEAGVHSTTVLRRDPSPVEITADTVPARPPEGSAGRKLVLYSGNWGVAHDHETFVRGYQAFDARHPGKAWLWLNATGKRVGQVADALSAAGLPFGRTAPVPLDQLPGVLAAADVHLITLEDAFVGYVMPSKVYACIASGRPVLFIGSPGSDVHTLCRSMLPAASYRRVDVGDSEGVCAALVDLLGIQALDDVHH